jgi:hypothetical protein
VADTVKEVQRVPSGFALVPKGRREAQTILDNAKKIDSLLGGKTEAAQEWHTYICARTVTKVYSLGNSAVEISPKELAEEALFVTGVKPLRASWGKVEDGGTRTAIIAFPRLIKVPFCLFGDSAPSRPLRRRTTIRQCENCHAFHDTRACRNQRRCAKCGEIGDHGRECAKGARCANCLGPHLAGYEKCPARPRVSNGAVVFLTHHQRAAVRKAGKAASSAVND